MAHSSLRMGVDEIGVDETANLVGDDLSAVGNPLEHVASAGDDTARNDLVFLESSVFEAGSTCPDVAAIAGESLDQLSQWF